MTLAEHIADHVSCGCTDMSRSLGAQKMPDGYALMLNPDRSHFYGLKHDGTETDIHWNKWAIYRWAKKSAALTPNACYTAKVPSNLGV